MNILRELRKFKRKSVLVKLRILLLLAVMLIMSTYAWWRLTPVEVSNLTVISDSWDVDFKLENEDVIEEEEIVISVDNFQPGMDDFEKIIRVRSFGTKDTEISYELTSVKFFGEEVLAQLEEDGEILLAGTTVNLFVNSEEEKYPFEIMYTYDKKNIQGIYVDDETTPESVAKLKIYASWDYNQGKDALDTEIGKRVYEYYSDPSNNLEEILQFSVKITAKAIHL